MAEKTIRFTQNARYDSIPPVQYVSGQSVTLREDLADRWLKRGVAVDVDAEKAAAKTAAKAAIVDKQPAASPVDIPANWRFLKADDKIALAKKLGADDAVTPEGANDAIAAEMKKRDDAAKA